VLLEHAQPRDDVGQDRGRIAALEQRELRRDRRLELLHLPIGGELLRQGPRRGDFRRPELAVGDRDAFDLQAQRAGGSLATVSLSTAFSDAW
jgi:hypothetical protein